MEPRDIADAVHAPTGQGMDERAERSDGQPMGGRRTAVHLTLPSYRHSTRMCTSVSCCIASTRDAAVTHRQSCGGGWLAGWEKRLAGTIRRPRRPIESDRRRSHQSGHPIMHQHSNITQDHARREMTADCEARRHAEDSCESRTREEEEKRQLSLYEFS